MLFMAICSFFYILLRYDGELTVSPNHKCTQRDMSHTHPLQQKLKNLIAFMKESRGQMPGSKTHPDEAVVEFETQVTCFLFVAVLLLICFRTLVVQNIARHHSFTRGYEEHAIKGG